VCLELNPIRIMYCMDTAQQGLFLDMVVVVVVVNRMPSHFITTASCCGPMWRNNAQRLTCVILHPVDIQEG
jgi:hypothetical protein